MKDYLRGTGLFVLSLIIAAVLAGGWFVVKVALADPIGAGKQKIATKGNAQYRIAAYDRFFDTCSAIQSKEDAIANLEAELATADPARAEQIAPAITANKNVRAALIRRYNADAAKEGTRGDFRASALPYSIDPNGTTECSL